MGGGSMVEALVTIAVGCAFLAAGVIDVRERRIPNGIVAVVAVLGLVRLGTVAAFGGGMTAVLIDGAVALAGFAIMVPAFRFGVMGGGDVKLITAGILWFGASGAASFIVVTVLAGGVLSLAMLVSGRLGGRPASDSGSGSGSGSGSTARSRGVPYGVAIAAGAFVTMAVGIAVNSPALP